LRRIAAWIKDEHYDIEATLPAGATKSDIPQMLQRLLSERFQPVLLSDGVFDLIVLDLTLPKLSGFDVLEQCQTDPVPIVVFTGGSDTNAERHALDLGAREYLRKPVHFEAYKEVVRQIVQRWGQKLCQTSGTI
jgi:DNA-binding response OmpR family regulator